MDGEDDAARGPAEARAEQQQQEEDEARTTSSRGGGGGKRGGGKSGGAGRAAAAADREKQISRALSRLLRHQALNAGIVLDKEGYAPLEKVVSFLFLIIFFF